MAKFFLKNFAIFIYISAPLCYNKTQSHQKTEEEDKK